MNNGETFVELSCIRPCTISRAASLWECLLLYILGYIFSTSHFVRLHQINYSGWICPHLSKCGCRKGGKEGRRERGRKGGREEGREGGREGGGGYIGSLPWNSKFMLTWFTNSLKALESNTIINSCYHAWENIKMDRAGESKQACLNIIGTQCLLSFLYWSWEWWKKIEAKSQNWLYWG